MMNPASVDGQALLYDQSWISNHSTSFPGLSYEDEWRDEKALVWASHVTIQKWQYLTATSQGVARYSLMKYISLRNK
jgi:hypothetical protein